MHKARSLDIRPTAALGIQSGWVWMLFSLMAHTGWGAYPVLARYLQTVSHIPSMALLTTANIVALVALLPFVTKYLDLHYLRSPVLWGLALIVVLRAITNMLAARYTHAIYVQLITLMTPLLVALMSAGLFRDKLPPYTMPAIAFSLLGSLLMITGNMGAGELTLVMGMYDWIGIGLAILSTLCLASYMLIVPRIMRRSVPGETVLVVQLSALLVSSFVISLIIGEDWSHFASLGMSDWAIFLVFALFVQLGANLGQIAALRHLGGPMVSSTMAWRLMSTLVMAALLLGERLTTHWQALGVVIVLATITTYLWQQRRMA